MTDRDSIQEEDAFGARVDRAMSRAFLDAVRLHRMHRLPLICWREERVQEVGPFSIPLPEDAQ